MASGDKNFLPSDTNNDDEFDGLDVSQLAPGNRDDFKFAFDDEEVKKNNARRYAIPTALAVLILGLSGYFYSNFAGATSVPGAVPTAPGTLSQADTTSDTKENSGTVFNSIVPAAGTVSSATPDPSPTTPTSAATPQLVPPVQTAAAPTVVAPSPPPAMPSTPSVPVATPPGNSAAVVEIPPGQSPAMPAALTPETSAPANANAIPNIGGAVNTQAAAATTGMTPMGATVSVGAVSGTAAAPVKPSANAAPSGPDAYYDAGAASPGADAAMSIGPRKVDPTQEPASKYVLVNKDESAQGINAQVVAAGRALKLGHYDAATDMFDTLYAKNSRDPRILMGRAVAYQKAGRPDTAMKMYDELLDIDSDNADALLNMLGLLRKQYPDVALRRLINLHNKYPNNSMIVAQIGVTEADQNQFDDAMRYLTMAVSMDPNNAQHQFNLAVTADRSGHKDDAVKYYQQALETDAVYGESRSIPREKVYDRLAALRLQKAAPVSTAMAPVMPATTSAANP